jgi:hypothetical protein
MSARGVAHIFSMSHWIVSTFVYIFIRLNFSAAMPILPRSYLLCYFGSAMIQISSQAGAKLAQFMQVTWQTMHILAPQIRA